MELLRAPAAGSPCIVYLAHGSTEFRDQALFSILTLHGVAPRAPIRIIVFTDAPDVFASAAHDVILYTAAEARADSGRFRYVHRAKIKILERVLDRFPAAASWMLVDGDTVWSCAPDGLHERLGLGCAVMHAQESMVGPNFHRRLHACLKRVRPAQAEFLMRNSGVIGLPPTGARRVLGEVLALTDELLVQCWQRGWAEQVAFSLVLQLEFDIVDANDAILHYYSQKGALAGPLRRFLADVQGRDLHTQVAAALAFDLPAKIQQVGQGKRSHTFRERLRRLRSSWQKRVIDVLVLAERMKRSRASHGR